MVVAVPDARRAVEAVWRIESGRLIAALARMVGDLGLAEELAQDALVAALERWPVLHVSRARYETLSVGAGAGAARRRARSGP